jgi:Ca2+/Na+ antiporter
VEQLAVATGALFSTIGSGYILQSGLPPTTEFSLADAFQITAFTVTFLTMLMIFIVHVLRKRRMWKAALTTGRVMFALYLVSVAWIIYRVWLAVSA